MPVGVRFPATIDVAAALPRVDNDSGAPSRSDDLTLPLPINGDVRDPSVEKLVER